MLVQCPQNSVRAHRSAAHVLYVAARIRAETNQHPGPQPRPPTNQPFPKTTKKKKKSRHRHFPCLKHPNQHSTTEQNTTATAVRPCPMIHTCAADSYARKTAGFQLRRPVNSNTPSFTASAFSSVSSPPRTLPWVCSLTPRSLKFLGIVEHYRLQLLLSSPQRAFWGRYPCLSEFATCPLWSGRSISSLVLRTATNARRTAAADGTGWARARGS